MGEQLKKNQLDLNRGRMYILARCAREYSQFAELTTTVVVPDSDIYDSAALHHKSTCV